MNRALLLVLALIWYGYSYAQIPLIQDLDKDHGAMAEVVIIKGNNFGIIPGNIQVFFGAVEGSVVSVNDHVIEVSVPPGASHDNVSVYRKDKGLTAYSSKEFFVSFGGTSDPLAASDFAPQVDADAKSSSISPATSPDTYDLCLCDFNKDGKPDVITANDAVTYLSVFKNNGGTLSKISDLNLLTRTIHINCGDLNNDGNYDLIATEDGNLGRLFFMKGDGSLGFAAPQSVSFPGMQIRQLQIADLDLDGRAEVILSNKSKNEVIILPNTSTAGTISFGPDIHITIPPFDPTVGTYALQVKDLNNDNAPDIVVAPTLSPNVCVLKNKSTANNFQFDAPLILTVPGNIAGLKVGDLDNDGKAEIAVTKFNAKQLVILKNTTSNGNISFQSPLNIDTELIQEWGVEFGDLNGDGRPDIIVTHILASDPVATPIRSPLTLLENKGGLTFQKVALPKNDVSRYAKIADMNMDGKPDIVGNSIDFFVNPDDYRPRTDVTPRTIKASKVFIIKNLRCMQPKITPDGPINVCSNENVVLTSRQGGGVTYQWKEGNPGANPAGSNISGSSNTPVLTILSSQAIDFDYKMVVTAPGCPDLESNIVHVKTSPAVAFTETPPLAPDPAQACTGANSSVKLEATVTDPAVLKFKWEGPNFNPPASTSKTATVGGAGVGLTLANAGYYTVSYLGSGDCVLKKSNPVLVNITSVPDFAINLSKGDVICANGTTSLSIFPSPSGFTYQWFTRNADNSETAIGTANQSYDANAKGKYFAKMSTAGCNIDVSPVTITQRAEILPSFDAPSVACTTQEVQFNNTTVETEALKYSWEFADNKTSTDKSPRHTYATPSSGYLVKLTATYADGTCPGEKFNPVKVLQAPALKIVTPSGKDQICHGGEVELSVTGATFTGYKWSTNETSATIKVDTAMAYKAIVTTATGCVLEVKTTLTFFPETQVAITSTPLIINAGEAAQLSASGLTDYRWSPPETLSDSTIANPSASPIKTTTYTVKGTDTNGCVVKKDFVLEVISKALVFLLQPKNFFSPNHDGQGDDGWKVGNIESYPACGVTVYDEKGVKVFEARPYNNDWEGTFNGRALPNGVYYYVLRCDGEENIPRAGSITLLR